MYSPSIIRKKSFQLAWIDALKHLKTNNWRLRNLVVQITNPNTFDDAIHQKVVDFARSNNILTPKHVAYTIFPHNINKEKGNANELFIAYNRPRGFYERMKNRHGVRWGTYFRRMIFYERDKVFLILPLIF